MATDDGPLTADRIPTGGNQKPDSRSNKRSRIPPPKAPPTNLISANLDSLLLHQNPSAHTSDWVGIQSCPPKLSSHGERHEASSFGFQWEAHAIQPQQLVGKYEESMFLRSNEAMPTPVSMSGARSPLLSPTGGQKMEMSSPQHVRQLSEDHSSSDEHGGSLFSSCKRAEEPPRNHEAKIICKHQKCTGLTFDRKCEWK
jgi:hypothetical protein